MRDVFDIDSARSDISRDEKINRCSARLLHHAITLGLRHATVQRLNAVASASETFREVVDFNTGATKDDRQRRTLKIKHTAKRGNLVSARHDIGCLPHLWRSSSSARVARNENALRILEMSFCDAGNARRNRRGEERGLSRLRSRFENEFEILGETHVEHFVGFVEHDRNEIAQIDCATTHVIKHASWSCDHHMRAATKRNGLAMEILSTVDRCHRDAEAATVTMKRFGNLHCQLAGGNQHQHQRLARLRFSCDDALQQWQRKGSGLASAGSRLAQDVSAFKQQRNRRGLNRCGLLIAKRCQLGEEFRAETKLYKRVLHRYRVAR